MANNYRIFLYKPEAVSVTADNAAQYFLGELLVDNLDVSIKLQDISTINFSVPRIINGTANTRIDEVLDGYVIEVWYGDLEGAVDEDYYRYRFTIYNTPVSFSGNKLLHTYTGYSIEALTELKMLVSWPGVEISDFYRKISYNNNETTPLFTEPKDTVTGGNFQYTITTSGSGANYITLTPTTSTAADIDIFIYEVRQRLESGSVVSESEAGLIPYSGSSPNDIEFKNGYYFLTFSGEYVSQIHIALPDNYEDFNGEDISQQILFFKLYDNPLSRRYAIGITTNAEEANDMYIDLAHDVAEGNPTDFSNFNFQTQKFYSKNGLTLKQILLGKENTTIETITEDGLLFNTGFILGTIEPSLENLYRSNLEFNNTTRYQSIKTLAESFDSIAVYDTINNTVSFYPENIYGDNNGLMIRYGAYLKALNKEIDASKIITNGIGLGKDNLTINLVNPTGQNYWEDYSYYLDNYYISSAAQIGTITEDANLGITFNYVDTSNYTSKWMSITLAEPLAKWQYTRDWFHSILTGEFNPVGYSSTITQFYNLYEERLAAIRLLIKKETEYFTALKREVKFQAFRNYYDKLSKDFPNNTTYVEKYEYYKVEFENAKQANNALKQLLETERGLIFDENISGSFAEKMVVLQSFLQKDSMYRNINLNNLRPFQRENVVNDNSIDDEKDLLEIVKNHVDENKEPKVTISIDIADILAAQEAKEDWNKVKIGDKINIYLDELNVDVLAQIREINVNFETHTLSFVISTVRNYNQGFGNFVLKTIRKLYNSNNNNVQYEVDGTRYSRETSENVNNVLNNGLDTNNTVVNSGLVDDNGNSGTQLTGSGTISASIAEVDPLTETVTSYVSPATQGVIIADGKVLSYHNYTSPDVYSSEIEISAETGFRIRKIEDGIIENQVYIDTSGNAVFAGKLQVGTGAPQTIDEVFDNIGDLIEAGTTVFSAANETDFNNASTNATENDILFITADFSIGSTEYLKDQIYRYNSTLNEWEPDLDLANKISGSVGGWTINSSTISSNNNNVVLSSTGYLSMGQSTKTYDSDGIYLGIDNSTYKLSLQSNTNYLKWNGVSLDVKGEINATSGTILNTMTVGNDTNKITILGGSTSAETKIYSGTTGLFNDESTGFYMDALGQFSLGESLSWNGSSLNVVGDIGGTIGEINVGNITIDNDGIVATDGLNEKFILDSNSGDVTIVDGKLSIGQTTQGFNQNGIFLGIDTDTKPKISLKTNNNTFFKYQPSAPSGQFDLEIEGNAKIGPLLIGNELTTSSSLTLSSGLLIYIINGGQTTIIDTTNQFFEFVFDTSTKVSYNISGFSFTASHTGSRFYTLTLFNRNDTIQTFSAAIVNGTNTVPFLSKTYNVTRVRLTLGPTFDSAITSIESSSVTIAAFRAAISLNDFLVTEQGDLFLEKITLGNTNEDKIILEKSGVGNQSREIKLTTPATAILADRVVRLPDANGTIALNDAPQTFSAIKTFSAKPIFTSGAIFGSAADAVNSIEITSTGNIIFEGSSADANETILNATNPTEDRTITLPNLTGTVNVWSLVKSNAATSVSHTGTATTTTITLNESGASIENGDLLAIEVNSNTDTAAQRTIVYYRVGSVIGPTTGTAGITWVNTQLSTTAGARRWYSMDLYRNSPTQLIARYCQFAGQAPNSTLGSLTWTGSDPAYIWRIWKVL
jgi:hypothetical protein